MDRQLEGKIALFGSLENSLYSDSGDADRFINTTEPYCLRCGKFTPSKSWNGWEKKEIQLADLEGSSADGCEVCEMLAKGLLEYQKVAKPDMCLPTSISVKCVPGKYFHVLRPAQSTTDTNRISINTVSRRHDGEGEMPRKEDVVGPDGLEFFVTPEASNALKHVGLGRPVCRELSDDGCIELAHRWILECQEHHPRCRQPLASLLPTRLIDVGSEQREPRLVETFGRKGQYAALSHCWGKVQPLTTTSATLKDNLKAVPMCSLPKTFSDAVLLTRKLKLQYLWIDSLCIIQDSTSDWQIESSKMGQVYRGSTVTIASVSAADGREGCFVDKKEWRDCVSIAVTNAQGLPAIVYIRSTRHDLHDIGQNRLFEREPLSGRAWVLQERLLSTRILLYTSTELVFECRTDLYCECGDFPFKMTFTSKNSESRYLVPSWDSENLTVSDRWNATFTKAIIHGLTWFHDWSPSLISRAVNILLQYASGYLLDREEAFQFWRTIVEQYTARCLTFDRDALPALSSLARMLQLRVIDTYLAGLWRGDLHRQLLWSKRPSIFSLSPEDFAVFKSLPFDQISQEVLPYRPRRTSELCPPTWSWASIRGAVWYGGMWMSSGNLEELAEIIDASCALASANPFGSVSGGQIVLRAPVAPIRLGLYEVNLQDLLQRCRVGELICDQNNSAFRNQHEHVEQCIEWNYTEWAVLDLPPEESAVALDEQEFWRLRIAKKSPPHTSSELQDYAGRWLLGSLADEISRSHTIVYHLLLKSKSHEQCFERVGLLVKAVPSGVAYPAGELSTVKIL